MKNQRRIATFFALLSVLIGAARVDGQIGSTASLTGTVVTSPGSRPVPGTLVTVRSLAGDASFQTNTSASGSFSVPSLQPGQYEIRVEALGYRPLVVRGLVLLAGDERNLALTITVDPPPVERVDTLTITSNPGGRNRAEGLALGTMELRQLPYRFDDIGSMAAMETSFDGRLGSEGLPGELTVLVADGVPFYRATHPTARTESLPSPLVSRNLISGVSVLPRATDITLPGAAGGHVSASTRRNNAGLPNIGGTWSGDPLWSSSELNVDAPTLLSWQGFANASAIVAPGSRLFVAADGLRHESPLAARLPDPSTQLTGLSESELQALGQPGVQSVQRISGLARFDRTLSPTDRLFFRAMLGVSERSYTDAGPLRPADVPDDAVDFSTAFGYVGQTSPTVTLDFRGGVSGSYRDFEPGGFAPATLGDPVADLGSAFGLTGSSSRTDFVLLPGLLLAADGTQVRLGLNLRASRHSMEQSDLRFAFSDGAARDASSGFGSESVAPSQDFTTRETGLHAQLRGDLSPTMSYSAGLRYDLEGIGGDVVLSEDWLLASGLANTEFRDSFHQFGGRAALTWTPVPGGSTQVQMQGSLDHGDLSPRWIYGLHAEATDATTTKTLGSSVDWPDASLPGSAAALPSVTLFGPGARAPKTLGTDLLVLQGFGQSTVVSVRGSSRRTDFLMRRRNLNLPVVAAGQDSGGRSIWGTLSQDGSLVAAVGGDARRFNNFGVATALDPDGWSEYRGATVSLDHTSADVSLFGSYTWSETTDNWFGASGTSPDASLRPGIPTAEGDPEWSEGISDFDVTHRASVGTSFRVGPANLSALFRYESGLPFTPGYRFGVDANGDGSAMNDAALATVSGAGAALSAAGCSTPSGPYADRNSCRAPAQQTLNLRVAIDLTSIGIDRGQLTVDVLNAVESPSGMVDSALLLVDPAGSITTTGSTVTLPTMVNPDFGSVIYPTSMGRMIRVGFRIGA